MARQEKVQINSSHMMSRKLAVFRKALSYIFVDKIFYKANFIVEQYLSTNIYQQTVN